MDIFKQKQELRKRVKNLKIQYSLSHKKALSNEILKQLEELSTFQNAEIIMAYWSMDDEVFTHDFIQKWSATKKIVLPVVHGSTLQLKLFRGVNFLVPGENFGIPEPQGDLFQETEKIELIIVPGVAFDIKNNRMGRGKAYYDQFLSQLNAIKIGVCFDFQLFDEVPHDELDIKMDHVITNKKESFIAE